MRRVDINGRAGQPPPPGVDETWVMNPDVRRGDPVAFDGTLGAIANVHEYVVTLPNALGTLADRLTARRRQGAPAIVRLCPGISGHGFPLESWAVSPIPEFCEREELALAVDYGDAAFPWSEIVAFARGYPRLAVLALGAPLGGPTAARALDATPNLVFDTTGLSSAADLPAFAAMVRACGAYRVAYGSGTSRVNMSEIERVLSVTDGDAIFSGTAGHLFAGTWASEYL
ncbi:MAG TPA: hypothetical protein VG894_04755 [Bauldia sp.]|nr:hypothetical protein [Bauldia sp.]